MKALVPTEYGAPGDVLSFADVAEPTVGDDEIVVRVEAATAFRSPTESSRCRP